MAQRGYPDFFSKFNGVPLTPGRLKECVLSNLSGLFDCHHTGLKVEQAKAFPYARDSVINYSVRDFSSGRITPADYAEHIKWAIQVFENRLTKETLQVRHVNFKTPRPYWVFRIDGDIRAECGWSSLCCYLVIDLEGHASIID